MRAISHPITEQLSLPGVMHALSDPVRLEIVRALAGGIETSCGEIGVPVSKSTLSHHLKVLRDAGLTQTRAEGVHRLVSLRAMDIDARFPGLLECVLEHASRRAPGTVARRI
ncbi:MAG: helix-turn-helix domain-containing protein [Actinomycetota bacterium]|nr:helix-turn-helix domain-containing protein [Actinomycetota bacterium]